jgi:hypothetical protein
MTSSLRLHPAIDGRRHLPEIPWQFSNPDAAELAYRQAIDAINRIYLMPGNADRTQRTPQP